MSDKRGKLILYRGSYYDCVGYMGMNLDFHESSDPYSTIVVSNDRIGYNLSEFINNYRKIIKKNSTIFLMVNVTKEDFVLIQMIKDIVRNTSATLHVITTDRQFNYLNSLSNHIVSLDGEFSRGRLVINANVIKRDKQLAVL